MNVNVFLILTATAKNALRPLMSDYEYDGQHLKAVKIFRKMAHFAVVEPPTAPTDLIAVCGIHDF